MESASFESLIDYLLSYADRNKIKYRIIQMPSDYPSVAYPRAKEIFINANWKPHYEIPFAIGHEIGHIIHGDTAFDCQSPQANDRCEIEADRFSARLIFSYALDVDCLAKDPQTFVEVYGLPERLVETVKKLYTVYIR